MKSTKVLFAGIGGVGGYYGGRLARQFEKDKNVEVHFLARGAHLEKIKKDGLKVIQGENQFIARPTTASDNPKDIGIADFIIICTKTYDLKSITESLAPCIDPKTVIVTVLNGPNNMEVIQDVYPNNLVLNGCVYIIARLKQPGVVENLGTNQSLFFGKDNYTDDNVLHLENLLKTAGIKATYSKNISDKVWEKFIFLSPLATATTCLNKTIGEVLDSEEGSELILQLTNGVKQIAEAKLIAVADDIGAKTLAKLRTLPRDATSSMHSDFRLKKPNTELDALTNYVVAEGKKHGIKTPAYSKALNKIIELSKTVYAG